MKNFTLAGLAQSIPYYPRLGALVGVVPALVLVQLDFLTAMVVEESGEDWVVKKTQPFINGFYKYISPPKQKQDETGRAKPLPRTYRAGDSWSEWLGCSADVFQTAFEKIGVPYASIKQFNKACTEGDPFLGKLYISVFDHNQNLTFWYRNHGVVDQFLADFSKNVAQPIENKRHGKSPSPENRKTLLRRGGKPFSGEEENPDPLTEITTEITSEITKAEAERTENEPAAAAFLKQDQNPKPKPACSNTEATCQRLVEPFLKNETDDIRWAAVQAVVDPDKLLAKIQDIISEGKNPYATGLLKWARTVKKQAAAAAAEVQESARVPSLINPEEMFKTLHGQISTYHKGV